MPCGDPKKQIGMISNHYDLFTNRKNPFILLFLFRLGPNFSSSGWVRLGIGQVQKKVSNCYDDLFTNKIFIIITNLLSFHLGPAGFDK